MFENQPRDPARELTRSAERAARGALAMSELPSVATADWCDAAASVVGHLLEPSLCVLTVGTLSADGVMAEHEASGVALATVRIGKAVPLHTSSPDSRLATLRVRADRIDEFGFEVDDTDLAGTIAAPISDLAKGDSWRQSDLARLWQGMEVSDLMIGITRLGKEGSRRVLVAQVAPLASGSRVTSADASVLRALLPLLGERACRVLGPDKATPTLWLTTREQQVLEHLTLGKSVRSIADELDRSPHTVHDHVKSLHRKLGASSRGELIARALGHLARPVVDESANGSAVVHTTNGVRQISQAEPASPARAIATAKL